MGRRAVKHQIVLDDIHLPCRIAHDVDQHLGLVAQQMREQLARRSERLARLDRGPQPIDGLQWRRPRAHQHPAIDIERHGRRGRRFEREERHVVQDAQQGVAGGLDARAAAEAEEIVKVKGQVEMLSEPSL